MFSEPQNSSVSTGALAPDEQIPLRSLPLPCLRQKCPGSPGRHLLLHAISRCTSEINCFLLTIKIHVGKRFVTMWFFFFFLKSKVQNSIYSVVTALLKNRQNHSTERKTKRDYSQSMAAVVLGYEDQGGTLFFYVSGFSTISLRRV